MLTDADLSAAQLSEIRSLLNEAFAGRFAPEDWEHTRSGARVIVSDAGRIVSHAAVVPRRLAVAQRPFSTGYVEGVATTTTLQRRGLASLAMTRASMLIRDEYELGCLSTGEHAFYERLGWERWCGATFVRDGAREIRTEEEDEGVMVLRFGPSGGVDLSAQLSCERRAGDDW